MLPWHSTVTNSDYPAACWSQWGQENNPLNEPHNPSYLGSRWLTLFYWKLAEMQCPTKIFPKMLEKYTSVSQASQFGAFRSAAGRFLQFSKASLHGKGWGRKKAAIRVQCNAWERLQTQSGPTGALKSNIFFWVLQLHILNIIFLNPRQDQILNRMTFLLHFCSTASYQINFIPEKFNLIIVASGHMSSITLISLSTTLSARSCPSIPMKQ